MAPTKPRRIVITLRGYAIGSIPRPVKPATKGAK